MVNSRDSLLSALARHVVDHGLQTASLRPLAKAAGTSDRMLIYHFGSRNGVLDAVLEVIAAQLVSALDDILEGRDRIDSAILLAELWHLLRAPAFRPVLRLWLELVSVAGRDGGDARKGIANRIATGFLDWIAGRLIEPEDAPLILAVFEGMLVLHEAGAGATASDALDRIGPLLAAVRPRRPDP